MEEIRFVRPEEFAAAVRLADQVFRDAEHVSMGEAFPHVFSGALGQSFGYFVGGELVSFIGLVPSVVRIEQAALDVCSVGAVCTSPDHRGKGYASAVLSAVLDHCRKAGAPLLLISGQGGIYERAGSRPFGAAAKYTLDGVVARTLAESDRGEKRWRFRPFAPTDWFRIVRLARRRPVRFEQSLWDMAFLIAAEPMASNGKLRHRVWVAEHDDDLAAFAVLGVPCPGKKSGRPILIEWAGDPEGVIRLAASGMLAEGLNELDVTVPFHETGLRSVLDGAGCGARNVPLSGTAIIVDAAALIRQLAPYLERKDGERFRSMRFEPAAGGEIRVVLESGAAIIPPEKFVSLVFDPEPDLPLSAEMKRELAALFPVPFPSPAGLNFV